MTYPDSTRRGLLGQGSILVQTSLANRTSPVLRGKWVMEVLIGMPPPPPPPNVPTSRRDAGRQGRPAADDARAHGDPPQERRRASTCHQYMDPIGLSLDNFDVTGKWRYRENGMRARHARSDVRRHAGVAAGRPDASRCSSGRSRWCVRLRRT